MSLDVVTVVSDTTPKSYVAQCRASVRRAVAACPYPVNVIETPGVPGHIGEAYRGGYELGQWPWVTWVDDDDFVLPNAFSCLSEAIEQPDTDAIFAREILLGARGQMVPIDRRHHLAVYRRDALASFDWDAHPARLSVAMQSAVVAPDRCRDVLAWVYFYRQRLSGGMRLRNDHQ